MTNNLLVYRDLNVEDGSLFDKDETLNAELDVRWDINIERDTDKNGILDDDWLVPKDTGCKLSYCSIVERVRDLQDKYQSM